MNVLFSNLLILKIILYLIKNTIKITFSNYEFFTKVLQKNTSINNTTKQIIYLLNLRIILYLISHLFYFC